MIIVVYHSQEFGNTKLMAEAVAEGVRSAGMEVKILNTNDVRVDIEEYRQARGAVFGSPDYFSYIAGGLKVFLDDWLIAKRNSPKDLTEKPFGLFFSHGGGGAVKTPLESLFDRMGTKIGDTVESKGKPEPEILEECKTLGKQIADSIR